MAFVAQYKQSHEDNILKLVVDVSADKCPGPTPDFRVEPPVGVYPELVPLIFKPVHYSFTARQNSPSSLTVILSAIFLIAGLTLPFDRLPNFTDRARQLARLCFSVSAGTLSPQHFYSLYC